jgi:hypothetical protein
VSLCRDQEGDRDAAQVVDLPEDQIRELASLGCKMEEVGRPEA